MEKSNLPRILRKPQIKKVTALSDPTIWRLEKAGKFPKRLQLGDNSVGWLEHEVLEWIASRPRGAEKSEAA
ncbi:MAG: AlpA family phage regulatory protein [Desulfobacteraceae bacterium]|nr:AlpA family phage regulatory protein [Desulfobacteraceae bacterium]MBC2754223.1 AlpA family phage regulatory protein [Desulfobacteraceae bacterium]